MGFVSIGQASSAAIVIAARQIRRARPFVKVRMRCHGVKFISTTPTNQKGATT